MRLYNPDLKVQVVRRHDRNYIEVWVGMDEPDYYENFAYTEKGIVVTRINHSEQPPEGVKPFLNLSAPFAHTLFKALAEYLSNAGIKTKDENMVEGKLQATEEHLKDMREIAKKLLGNLCDTHVKKD